MQPSRPGRPDPRAQAQQATMAAAMAGAVDLAAVKARTEAAQRAQAAPPPDASAPAGTPGSSVVDVSEATFQAEVLDRSFQVPVVLDLWAEWCGPCKQLSPVLERFALEDGGSWVLAKVDVDANPQLSAAAQVQSIPTVLVVWQGQVIPGFQGAPPEAQVRDFITQVIALPSQIPAQEQPGQEPGQDSGDGAPDSSAADVAPDPELEAADDALARDDLDAAEAAYREILARRPEHAEA